MVTAEHRLKEDPADVSKLLNVDSRKKPGINMGGHHPSPDPALASGVLFAFGGNGAVAIAKPGPDPQVMAGLTLERMGGTPFFAGTRMYVRTYDHLLCIGQ
ncbi:MAG: hypothetical protein ACOCYV_03340 [Planctomycetota bacterium]